MANNDDASIKHETKIEEVSGFIIDGDISMGAALTAFWIVGLWILGMAAAKGFWSTLIAFFIPPYSWYLVAVWIVDVVGKCP